VIRKPAPPSEPRLGVITYRTTDLTKRPDVGVSFTQEPQMPRAYGKCRVNQLRRVTPCKRFKLTTSPRIAI
jgi:hypothetical protein